MTNKEIINKLRDNAELAMASYGYFHFICKQFKENDLEKLKRKNKEITQTDILDITYNGYVTLEHTTLINPEKLKCDFSPHKLKDSLNAIIYSFINLIQILAFLLLYLEKRESKRI